MTLSRSLERNDARRQFIVQHPYPALASLAERRSGHAVGELGRARTEGQADAIAVDDDFRGCFHPNDQIALRHTTLPIQPGMLQRNIRALVKRNAFLTCDNFDERRTA